MFARRVLQTWNVRRLVNDGAAAKLESPDQAERAAATRAQDHQKSLVANRWKSSSRQLLCRRTLLAHRGRALNPKQAIGGHANSAPRRNLDDLYMPVEKTIVINREVRKLPAW